MLFKRRIVEEEIPTTTPVVTQVSQPVVERITTVERDSMSGGTAIALILGGLVVIALVWYFAYWQPSNTVATQPSTTIIEHRDEAAQPIVTPAPVVNNPPVIVNPPANNTTIVNPPAEGGSGSTTTTTTDNPDSTTTTTTEGTGG